MTFHQDYFSIVQYSQKAWDFFVTNLVFSLYGLEYNMY